MLAKLLSKMMIRLSKFYLNYLLSKDFTPERSLKVDRIIEKMDSWAE